LAPILGKELVVIGTTRGAGVVPGLDLDANPAQRYASPAGEFTPPSHSLDALLDTASLPHHLVDLRHAPPDLLVGTTAMSGQTQLIDLDPKQAFDAVVHIQDITSVRGVTD
jgi:erythromycin esterase